MIGESLGPYRILEPLGAGGMGEVYLAEDSRLERRVALKLLSPELLAHPSAAEHLLREARTAASLNHPNICTVHEVGEADGRGFIAMEYVEGSNLADLIPKGGMRPPEVVRYGRQLADALSHAHQRGVVHRDLKPTNVRITMAERAKVLDFGLALRIPAEELERSAESRGTMGPMESTVGTVQYMAPEVFRGGTADRHSDIWSLGVVLYEMSCGRLPFAGRTAFELSSAILRDSPAPLPSEVSSGIRVVIGRCLAKEPSRRYGQASEVAAALETIESMLVEPATTPAGSVRAAPTVAVERPGSVDASSSSGVSSGERPEIPGEAPSAPMPEASGGGPTGRAGPIRSLAVLPLNDLSGDASQAYFSDGMTEALITGLAKIGGVKVISRTSVMRYRDTNRPLPEIADELAVDAIVEGSVLRAGDRVRISAQLIHAATDSHLWADSYERDVSDVLALQAEVARAISSEVGESLGPAADPGVADIGPPGLPRPPDSSNSPRRSIDPVAYEMTLQARSYLQQQTVAAMKSAEMWLERALDRDPDSSLAYSTLATLRIIEAIYGEERAPHEVMPAAAEAARRALQIDPRSGEAHTTLGMLQIGYHWDWKAADRSFRRALECSPNLAEVHQFYAYHLVTSSRPEEAIRAARRATDIDPLSPLAHGDLAIMLLWGGHLDEALASARDAVEVDPGRWRAQWALGMVLTARGDVDDAIEAYRWAVRVSGGESLVQMSMAQALIARGNVEEAETIKEALEARRRTGYVSAYVLAALASSLGNLEEALALLEQGLEERTFYMIFLKIIAPIRFARIADDPRFVRIIESVGIP